jgi:hypothetical protein
MSCKKRGHNAYNGKYCEADDPKYQGRKVPCGCVCDFSSASLLQPPPAASERCGECGHDEVGPDGLCHHLLAVRPSPNASWRENHCGHRCFPATGATEEPMLMIPAQWIIDHHHHINDIDYACEECCRDKDDSTVVDGFVCVYHQALKAIKTAAACAECNELRNLRIAVEILHNKLTDLAVKALATVENLPIAINRQGVKKGSDLNGWYSAQQGALTALKRLFTTEGIDLHSPPGRRKRERNCDEGR